MPDLGAFVYIIAAVIVILVVIPLIVTSFLRNVDAGSIRMVSWVNGGTNIYRGPGKSLEVPLLTQGTTLSSKAINVDLDITDQTADIDASGIPRPIKIQVLASAIVSVGDTDGLIRTAANRYFAKPDDEQLNTLSDLLTSAGRRAINLLTHDQLFSAKTAGQRNEPAPDSEDDDPLAIIIRKACSKELTDLGLIFNSLNIKVVRSEVAEARRRQSAAEAQANADIVSTQQTRRAKEAQLEAERTISDKSRELEQTKASNAKLVAEAEASTQDALAKQRLAELRATQVAQAEADALRVKVAADADATRVKIAAEADAARVRMAAQAQAEAEAIRILKVGEANAKSIQLFNEAIQAGGESYLRYRQIEQLPQIAPAIAQALAQAKLISISSDGKGAASDVTNQIGNVIQMVMATQLIGKSGVLEAMGTQNTTAPSPATSSVKTSGVTLGADGVLDINT
jgi:flotillin